MTVTEESRHRLHQALDRTIGEEEATTLMEHLPPVGWADVATKTDLAHLEERLALRFEAERAHVDARFEKIDGRFDVTKAYVEHLFDMARLDTEHITESMAAHAKATDERLDDMGKRLDDMGGRFDDIGKRFDDMGRWMSSMENRLTHQFWQFLTVIVAFGAILIGVLRYT